MRRLLIALALVAGVLSPAVSASSAFGDTSAKPPVTGVGVRLVDAPTATANDPRARVYIIDHLAPGKTIERRMEVVNHTRSKADVSMYSAAASVGKGGFVGADGRTVNELSSWTSVTPRSLSLSPEERAFVKVLVSVPALAVRGENYGVVWAQVTTPPKTAGGVTRISRAGIRLYLSVGPGGAPPSDFKIVSLTAVRDQDNVPVVQASVRNTGERALDLTGTLTLSNGPGGLSAGPFPIPLGTTLGIGDTEPVALKLDPQLPNGPWLAKITVKSGVTQRTAQATLTFPSGPGSGPAVAAETPFHLTWWMIAAGIAAAMVLLLLLLGLILRRRRKREDSPAGARRSELDPAIDNGSAP